MRPCGPFRQAATACGLVWRPALHGAVHMIVDPGGDVDIVIGKAVVGIPAHMKESVLKAGCIAAGEELFRIGRIAPSAQGPGQSELEVEQTVFAADRTVTASARRD